MMISTIMCYYLRTAKMCYYIKTASCWWHSLWFLSTWLHHISHSPQRNSNGDLVTGEAIDLHWIFMGPVWDDFFKWHIVIMEVANTRWVNSGNKQMHVGSKYAQTDCSIIATENCIMFPILPSACHSTSCICKL